MINFFFNPQVYYVSIIQLGKYLSFTFE